MSAHTPGPWLMEFTGPHAETREGFWEIAPAGPDGLPDWSREVAATADDSEANARLIAEAPEMLKALKAVLACDTWTDHNGHAYLRVNARSLNDLAAQIKALVDHVEGKQ